MPMANAGRDMCEIIRTLLTSPLVEESDLETADLLCQLGLVPDQMGAILLGVIRKAKAGDIRSIQFVRELSEEGMQARGSVMADDLRKLSVEELEGMLEN